MIALDELKKRREAFDMPTMAELIDMNDEAVEACAAVADLCDRVLAGAAAKGSIDPDDVEAIRSAAQAVVDRAKELYHDCECGPEPVPGVMFPAASNGDDSREWVEACDGCDVFTEDDDPSEWGGFGGDYAAAAAVGARPPQGGHGRTARLIHPYALPRRLSGSDALQ